MKNLKIALLFTLVSSALYAECLVPEIPVLPEGVVELKEKSFSENLSLSAKTTTEENLGEVLIQDDTYTWLAADGTVIAIATRDLAYKEKVYDSSGRSGDKKQYMIKIVDCERNEFARIEEKKAAFKSTTTFNILIPESKISVTYDARSLILETMITPTKIMHEQLNKGLKNKNVELSYEEFEKLVEIFPVNVRSAEIRRLPKLSILLRSVRVISITEGLDLKSTVDSRLLVLLAAIDLDSRRAFN